MSFSKKIRIWVKTKQMNNILLKGLCNAAIVIASFSSKANTADTTGLLANNTIEAPAVVTKTVSVKAVNVDYPSSLISNKDESIDYVKNFCRSKRNYLIHMYQSGKKYFPKIAAVLKKYNLPQELKVLVALESAFNPDAVSPAGAVGYWQLMNDVAKEYGLQITNEKNVRKDDRKNFAKSTLAAARYLHDRCKNLNNDLLLMVASYNWGIGNVWNAMRRTGKSKPGFWDIKKYLPAETKAYVMNFIALNVVFKNYDKFIKNKLNFDTETIEVPVITDAIKQNIPATD